MKIYCRVNFKDKAERKAFIYTLLISIIVSQFLAFIIWYFFDYNKFFLLLISSLAGILFGYKGVKKKV